MALVKFGGGIVKLSGSIAGNTFARNRSGDYVRSWKNPVNPHSDRQEVMRAVISFLAEYWHDELTAAQRGLWDTYAAAVLTKNRLGDDINLTGFNHFIRTNAALYLTGEAQIDAAPTILSLPEKDATLAIGGEVISTQTLTVTCSNAGWSGGADDKLCISLYCGQPQLASRNFYAGPWRYMDIIDATEGAAGTGDFVAPFSFALGQKLWIQARLITESGRVSNVWTAEPRVIEADPQALTLVTKLGPRKLTDLIYCDGTLSPDATCNYVTDGLYNGKISYRRSDSAYYLWWSPSPFHAWFLSVVKGTAGTAYWNRPGIDMFGPYIAAGTATGVATIIAGTH